MMLLAASGCHLESYPYRSEGFGFEVAFPPGGTVCTTVPGFFNRNVNGFYAWYDSGRITCRSEQVQRGMTVLGIRADYNTAEWPAERLLSGHCLDGSRLGIDIARVRALSFPAHASLTCLSQDEDGAIEVEVVTQAGDPLNSGDQPSINYTALLITTPARFEANLARFRTFLASARITPVSIGEVPPDDAPMAPPMTAG